MFLLFHLVDVVLSGCCYSIGYGAMMRPCCLKTDKVTNQAACEVKDRLGGATHYAKTCPGDADEAAKWIQNDEKADLSYTSSENSSSKGEGCCFYIELDKNDEPSNLKVTENSAKGSCKVPTSPVPGGKSGWAKKCPTTALAAADALLKSGGQDVMLQSGAANAQGSSSAFILIAVGLCVLVFVFFAYRRDKNQNNYVEVR